MNISDKPTNEETIKNVLCSILEGKIASDQTQSLLADDIYDVFRPYLIKDDELQQETTRREKTKDTTRE